MKIQQMPDGLGFEVIVENVQKGKIIWTLEDAIMVMNGTFIDPSLRGQNIGIQLLDHAANYAETNNYKMKAVCPYVVKMFEQSTNYDHVKV